MIYPFDRFIVDGISFAIANGGVLSIDWEAIAKRQIQNWHDCVCVCVLVFFFRAQFDSIGKIEIRFFPNNNRLHFHLQEITRIVFQISSSEKYEKYKTDCSLAASVERETESSSSSSSKRTSFLIMNYVRLWQTKIVHFECNNKNKKKTDRISCQLSFCLFSAMNGFIGEMHCHYICMFRSQPMWIGWWLLMLKHKRLPDRRCWATNWRSLMALIYGCECAI